MNKNKENIKAEGHDDFDEAFEKAIEELGDVPETEEDDTEVIEDEGEKDEESKGEKEEIEDTSESEGEDQKNEVKEDNEDEDDEIASLDAPEHWPQEQREKFSEINDNTARQLALDIDKKLQAAHTKRSQEHAEKVKLSDAVENIFTPLQSTMQAQGLDTVGTIKALIEERTSFMNGLQTNPRAVIENLARQYNVDLTAAGDGFEDEYKDPHVIMLEQKLAQLEGQYGQFQNSIQSQQDNEIQRVITEFQNEIGEDGLPKHPHFDKLKGTISALLQNGQAPDLAKAYDMAQRTDPELYQQILDKELESRSKAKEDMRKEDVIKAKKAKKRLSGHGVSRKAPKKIDSIDDALDVAMAQLSSG